MRTRSTILLSIGVALVMVLTAGQVMALTYSVSVQTDASTYSGAQQMVISGAISPAPGNNTAVFIKVYNPSSVLVIVASASVNATTGAFRDTEVTGGTSQWVAGQYLVNATWGASGPVISGTTTFQYATQNITSTTNSTTSSTTSTNSTTSSTTTSSTTSTTKTTSTTSSTTTSSTTSSSTTSKTSTTTSSTPTTKSSTSTIVITTSSTTIPVSTTTTTSSTSSSSSVSPYFAVGAATVVALAALSLMLGRRKTRGIDGFAPAEGVAP